MMLVIPAVNRTAEITLAHPGTGEAGLKSLPMMMYAAMTMLAHAIPTPKTTARKRSREL